MGFLSVHQLAVAACQYRCCIVLFQAFLVQVTVPTPHKIGRLLAVSPYMAELLAYHCMRPVWALYASMLTAIWQRIISLIISWKFDVLRKVIRLFLLQMIDRWQTLV
jgi:hypothetical protein